LKKDIYPWLYPVDAIHQGDVERSRWFVFDSGIFPDLDGMKQADRHNFQDKHKRTEVFFHSYDIGHGSVLIQVKSLKSKRIHFFFILARGESAAYTPD
jgi:hypothetical protein